MILVGKTKVGEGTGNALLNPTQNTKHPNFSVRGKTTNNVAEQICTPPNHNHKNLSVCMYKALLRLPIDALGQFSEFGVTKKDRASSRSRFTSSKE